MIKATFLGREAMATNSNPPVWFFLRCTLHYPQLPARETRSLSAFAFSERAFIEEFLTARAVRGALARTDLMTGRRCRWPRQRRIRIPHRIRELGSDEWLAGAG